jgi:hypothetical protein
MYGAKVLVLWRMTLRGVAYIYQRFGRTSTGSTLKMVIARFFESSVPLYQSAQRDITKPEFTFVATVSCPLRVRICMCVCVCVCVCECVGGLVGVCRGDLWFEAFLT